MPEAVETVVETPVEPIVVPFIECTVPSCSKRLVGDSATSEEAKRQDWRGLKESTSPPETRKGRTFLGWCPDCAKKHMVEE